MNRSTRPARGNQTPSAEGDSSRTAGSAVGDAEGAGPRPSRCRLERHRNSAVSARAQGGRAGVGLGEVPTGGDAGDSHRDTAGVGQGHGLGAAADSYALS